MNGERFRNSENFWNSHHKFQEKSSWCGPAVIQMAFDSVGIRKTQGTIARDVLKSWWGTDQRLMLAYLSRFFTDLDQKENSSFWDLSHHLNKNHIVILNFWDDLTPGEPDGHYSIAARFNQKTQELTLVDPSKARDGIWKINAGEFKDRWYDSLDVRNKIWIEGWMLWVDPKSKITKRGRK